MESSFLGMILSVLAALGLYVPEGGPNDWADHERYAKANAELATAPEVVFMGNSITDFWPVRSPKFWAEHPEFCGRGISGQTSTQMLCRFREDVLNLNPRVVVLLAGTNDIAQNQGYISNDLILGNIESMIDLARAHGMQVAVCSVLPSSRFRWRPDLKPAPVIKDLNEKIRQAVDRLSDPNVRYVDYHSLMKDDEGGLPETLSPDNCHPNAEGYAIMEKTLLESIGDWLATENKR